MTAPRKRVPATAPKKKTSVAAREAEAEDGFVIVEHRGVTLSVPVRGKVPIAAIDAFRAGDNYEGTKQLLGEQQWKSLSEAGMTAEELNVLAKTIDDARGKSQASVTYSTSTATR